jgi:hypothetical protein
MARSLFFRGRATEASLGQIVTTGAAGGQYAIDPIDGDQGYQYAGSGSRETPQWTLEKQRTYSVAAYRLNPMARAIIDTYTSFVVGDSGLSLQCTNDDVARVVNKFWDDPRNQLGNLQELLLRDHMLMGETALEMLVGPISGVTRFSPLNTNRVTGVHLHQGNALWPSELVISTPGMDTRTLTVAGVDDMTELRTGQVQWWPSWKTTLDDRRGQPFLGPILDWLDDYDNVLSNLVDRTSLARYLVWDVTLDKAGPDEIKQFIKDRGGQHIPQSGTVEVHNDTVHWEPKTAQTGAAEDTEAGKSILTNVASGAGLAKHWLAEADNSNRATSLTMAEPVLRRVGGVQNMWLGYMTELCRYAVDQAVAKGRLPRMVPSTDARSGSSSDIPAAQTVSVTGPEIAVSEAATTAATLLKLAQGIDVMLLDGTLSQKAAKVLAKKAWEQYAGVPYTSDLDDPEADVAAIQQAIVDARKKGSIFAAGAAGDPATTADDEAAVDDGSARLTPVVLT